MHQFRYINSNMAAVLSDKDVTSMITRATQWKQAARCLNGLTLAAGLCCGADLFAATYYVTAAGSDTAAGTQAAPWRTVQHAAKTAVAGDLVLVGGGVYVGALSFPNSGAAGKPIVFKNVTGQIPVIDGTGLSLGQWGALVGFNNVGYIRFEGFEVRNSPAYNVYIGGESHHIELVGLDVHSGPYSGIWLDGPQTRPAMSVISGNKVHDHAMGGITAWIPFGGYYRIEGNEVYNNKGTSNYDGIQVGGGNGGTHHVVVKNNVVHDNGAADSGEDGIDVGGHGINHHYLVEGNLMYNNKGSFKVHSGSLKDGYYIAGVSGFHVARFNRVVGTGYVSYGFPNPVALYNNTFINAGSAFMIYNEDATVGKDVGDSTYTGGDTGRMNVKNNVFWQDLASSNYIMLTSGPAPIDITYRSVRLQNNLYRMTSNQKIGWNSVLGPPVTTALFASYQQSNSPNYPDVGSLLTGVTWSQMFASATDYHLVAGSPAIDKGTPLTKAVSAGSNSTTVAVDRASYFHDGFCVSGECLNTPDTIVIGNTAPVAIVSINDATNTITIAAPRTWAAGAPVTLPYNGTAPDMGAFEYGSTGLPAPSNMRLLNVQ